MNKFLFGFTAGMLAGFLFAPDKGHDTRKRVARRSREIKEKFNDMIDSLSAKIESITDEGEEHSESAAHRTTAYSN